MRLIDWIKGIMKSDTESINENPTLTQKSSKGISLTTFSAVTINPTIDEIKQAILAAVNAFDEFILLEWIGDNQESSFIQGIGFGNHYRLEYVPIHSKEGYAYVKEGVSIEETLQYLLAFRQSHQIIIDGSWQWQSIV